MLYPLSYEGPRCTFAQQGGRVLVRRARAGCLAPDGLCRTCAACREPADPPPSRHAAPIVLRVVPSQEPEAGGAMRYRRSLLLARRVDGMRTGSGSAV
jgi:hypothetical protein